MPILLSPFADSLWAGIPENATPGSQLSQPAGLEALLEYNGIIIHDRSVYDKYRLKAIDGLHGGVGIRVNEDTNSGDHGSFPLMNMLDARSIIIEGVINTGNLSKMRDLQQALRTAFFSMVERPLIIRTGNTARDVYVMARISDKIGMREEQTKIDRFTRDFQISMRATDPRIYSINSRTYTNATVADGDSLITLIHAGNFQASPTIKLDGPMTNPIVKNTTYMPDENYQRFIKINGSIPSGATYTYDSKNGTLVNQLGVRKDSQLDVTSTQLRLTNGENILQLTTTGTSLGVSAFTVTLQDTWI